MQVFAPSLLDSMGESTSTNQVSDVSQMFNERGFYKSNSFSFDDNEIINDFNGNLMYEIPMYSSKGAGGLDLDMKLVYNGSVNHEVILSDSAAFNGLNTPEPYKYNFNFPEWILSVNGIAVQVMNFETRLLSIPTDDIVGNSLKKLIPGYHYSDGMKSLTVSDRDRIFILAGDGSVISLVNITPGKYSGTYVSDSKGSHTKAQVIFDQTHNSGTYANDSTSKRRKLELFMGDGLIYSFTETRIDYWDMRNSTVPARRLAQPFILDGIRNRFGTSISFVYNNSYSPYGRPLLSNVYGVQITYAPNGMLFEDNMLGIGNYKFHFSDVLGYSEDLQGSKYPKLARITNPLSQQALISYGHIIRTLYNAPCNVNEISLNITLSDVYRIATFKNFLNGSREYTYLGPISMEIDYTPTISAYGVIRSDNQSGLYKGYGRDPFFTNMITQKIDKDNGIPKSKTEIDYSYDPAGSENPSIDTLDVYSTTREVTSLNDTTNNESVGITNSKEYKVYPVKNYGAIIEDFKDLSATTKLMKEQILKPGGVFEEVNYRYFIGGQSGGGQFNGSFLLENKIVTTEGYTRKWLYSYEHKGDEADSLIRKKTEIDPLLTKTETFFDNLETILTFYYNDKVLFNRPLAEYGQKLYYLNGIDTATRIYDKDNNLLKKAAKRIIKTTNNDSGYYGQLISERIYSEINSSSYLETKYTYYKRDTTGMAFHGNNVNHGDTSLIFIEGNPKQKLMPDGNEERYFYYPISFSESTIPVSSVPQVSFKVKYINGTITTEKEYFSDPRFPSRIDNYKRYGDGTCDSLKRMYYLYNPLGKPYYIVDENRFLTMFAYEPQYNRIKSITLPGDFSTSIAVDTTSRIDTNSYFDTLHINSSGWGHYDEMSDSLRFVNTPNHLRYGCNLFNMNIQYTGGPEDAIINTFQGAFFKIDGGLFPKIIDILDANLELNVLQNQYLINGEPANPEDYVTKLYPVDSIGSTGYRKCNIDYYYNLYFSHYFSFSGTSQDIYLDDSNPVDCYTENNYNVTDLLNGFIVNSGKTLNGFYLRTFDILPPHEYSVVFQSAFFINDINNCPYPVEWGQSKTPRLRIYARIDDTDTLKKVSTSGSTYIYDYDDIHRTVTVKALMRSYQPVQEKRIKYHFDGFGNIKQKDIYNSDFGFDSLLYKFNFLNLPSNTFDASQDQTKFSYDFAGRQKKTVNADASNSVQAYSYQTSIPVYMGGSTLNRFYIEKQEFTDETGRKFNKYFDDVGNLLREEKFVVGDDEIPERSEEPYNPDSLYQIEVFPTYISLNTDYKYDKLNRLMEVFTPQGKLIKYYYDEFGRQSQRITPDAGKTNYGYDKNGNLITSQDENQRVQSTEYLKFCTKRTYDGLNRLLTIGDVKIPVNEAPNEGTMGDTILPVFDYISVSSDSLYIINVYDTISSTQYGSVFSSLPAGYSAANYTRGRLVATAFRTYLGESWSYKYYRYNWRGNVTTFWQKLAGMDSMKVFEYYYNSQNQPLNMYYQSGRTDWKFYKNTYDDAGRLSEAGLQAFLGNTGNLVSDIQEAPVEEENIEDGPGGGSWSYKPYAQYRYNKDQQLDTMTINHSVTPYGIKHSYNNRNWLSDIRRAGGTLFFREEITYNPNGNIKYNKFTGTYKNSFGSTGDMRYNYTYDNSNRLVKADFDSLTTSFDNITSYDKDGNFQILKRYGSTNNLEDNFSYSYYSNTNKLQKVSGSNAQYIYDPNGNLKVDSLSHNYNMRYDWRNLLTFIWHWDFKTGGRIGDPVRYNVFMSQYWYDEAGNRIRKEKYQWILTGGSPDLEDPGQVEPVGEEESGSWVFVEAVNYIRDIAGREIAIYSSNTLQQWNMYGLDNVGNIKANGDKLYYLKDHLGTVRVVMDTANTIVAGYDYDPWGYPLSNRTYEASSSVDQKYKFTSKQRDKESGIDGKNGYDYFGARYYDSRIGRWGGVEPLLEKFVSYSPYVYSLCNPIIFRDVNGKNVDIIGSEDQSADEIYDKFRNEAKKMGSKLPYASKLKGGRIEFKEGVKIDKNKLSNFDKKIYDAISGSKTITLEHVENPAFIRDGISYAVVGGTAGPMDDHSISVTHFINRESASYFENAGVNSYGEIIIHEILEAQLRLEGNSDAHDKVVSDYVPQIGRPGQINTPQDGLNIRGFDYTLFGFHEQKVYSYDPKTMQIQEWFPKNR